MIISIRQDSATWDIKNISKVNVRPHTSSSLLFSGLLPCSFFFGEGGEGGGGHTDQTANMTRHFWMRKSQRSPRFVLQWTNGTWNLPCSTAKIKKRKNPTCIRLHNILPLCSVNAKTIFFWLASPINNKGPASQILYSHLFISLPTTG